MATNIESPNTGEPMENLSPLGTVPTLAHLAKAAKSQIEESSDNAAAKDICEPEDPNRVIIDACSSFGQHIRQNITDTLNLRSPLSSNAEDPSSAFEAAVLKRLENFEGTVMDKLTEKVTEAFHQSRSLPDAIPTKPQNSSDNEVLDSTHCDGSPEEKASLGDKNDSSLSEAVSDALIQHIHDTIDETINSDVSSLSAKDNVAYLDVLFSEKLLSFEQSVLTKVSEVVSQLINNKGDPDVEDAGSLSGEADANEKDEKEKTAQIESSDQKSKRTQKNSSKKKGEKTIGFFTTQILKSLASCSTPEEKLDLLLRKHAEGLEKIKSTEVRQKQHEKQIIQLSREKDQLQAEHNRNVLAKSRLESLCRELQRQNKAEKEESLLRIREGEEKRKEVALKFQSTLNDISLLMQENSKKNSALKEENVELAQKLKALVEHYEMWEKHMEKVIQQKDLEGQLTKAKLAKANLQLKQEAETFLREKQGLLENMSELQEKCMHLATNEVKLRSELNDYTSKYEEFQTILSKSNQVFESFKTDMDTTTKKIKKLEKETNIWKRKWECCNNALLEMIADKQTKDKEQALMQQRINTLEKLCRALQAERNDLRNQVQESPHDGNQNSTSSTTDVQE